MGNNLFCCLLDNSRHDCRLWNYEVPHNSENCCRFFLFVFFYKMFSSCLLSCVTFLMQRLAAHFLFFEHLFIFIKNWSYNQIKRLTFSQFLFAVNVTVSGGSMLLSCNAIDKYCCFNQLIFTELLSTNLKLQIFTAFMLLPPLLTITV